MKGRAERVWRHPLMEKWGRLAGLLAAIEAVALWIVYRHPLTPGEQAHVLALLVPACGIGLLVSAATTRRYSVRGLGLFAIVFGFCCLGGWLWLDLTGRRAPGALLAHAAAAFTVGSPCFLLGMLQGGWERWRCGPREGELP